LTIFYEENEKKKKNIDYFSFQKIIKLLSIHWIVILFFRLNEFNLKLTELIFREDKKRDLIIINKLVSFIFC
jgi:hypothetical protein